MGKYCQNNEEEIIDQIFNEIGTTNKFAVEFGCHADHRLSNCLKLQEEGWKVQFYGTEKGEGIINEFFNAENVNDIFKRHNTPEQIDFMSIDIDGMDYYVWKALEAVKPRVVCIEYNILRKEGIQPYDPNNIWLGYDTEGYGACREQMIKLGESKGYKLVKENDSNLFFIQK